MSHTSACQLARAAHHHEAEARLGDVTPDWPLMWRLTVEEQRAVLACPDLAHEATRLFTRGEPWIPPWLEVS